MYLKQIIIQGFKSFADKTVIDLNEKITGIVGPNGSGKSNIVDAIKWVLGEQSIKSLRGEGSMSDVIFCGSKTRNPSSSASVTLVFNNNSKLLTSEYEEIEIKRKVYSTNENEYYINKQRCRLKDINDLLMDSGIQPFNIISQGDIANILSSKPEDRRLVIENAAKVLKYKKRKIESLRKLDKTEDNIIRINDITTELENQLEPLSIQKEKAEIYLKNKKELEEIEISLITYDITNFNEKSIEAEKNILNIKEELLNIETTSNIDDSELQLKKQRLDNITTEINTLKENLLTKTIEVEKINSEKNILLERKNNTETFEVKEELEIYKNKVQTINTEINELNNELKEYNTKYEELLLKHDIIQSNYQTNLNNINKFKNNQLIINNKIDILTKNIELNLTVPYSVKSILSSKSLKGIENTIGNIIETEEKYSVAIDVSLGSASNYIICQNENSAKNAIQYLKDNNLGKATFFPLNVIKERYIRKEDLDLLKNDIFYIASDIIKYDKKYENIVKNQLGNILITNNIDIANSIAKKLSYKYKIATLEGDIINIGGSITGGAHKKKNTIIDKIELDKLNQEQIELQKNITDLEKTNSNLKLNELDLEKQKTSNEIISIKEKLAIKNQFLKEYINKQDLLKQKQNLSKTNINKTEEDLIEKYYKELELKNNIIKQIDSLSLKELELRNSIEEVNHNLKTHNTKYNSLNENLKTLEINLTKYEMKLESLLQILNEEYNMTYDKAKEEYILFDNESYSRKKVYELKKTIRDLGEVNVSSIDEFKRINNRYEFLNSQKDDLYKAKEILLNIISEMDEIMKDKFMEVFKEVQEEFTNTFKELFNGGTAQLKLTDPNNILETGIDIIALPPGKKLQHLSLLSGGEKSLTAIALVFAILKIRPIPFSVLDEVEAALDEVNVDQFGKFLKTFKDIQFIVVTHKKRTMEYVDNLYGVTMQESGVSKLASVKLV